MTVDTLYDGPGPYDEDDSYDGGEDTPVALPSRPHFALLEFAFGADPAGDPDLWVWTHVPDGLLPDQTVSIKRGRADESAEPSPSQASFTLDNRDGRYTPTDPRSPYFPNVRRGTPVRFWASIGGVYKARFVGQVSEWAPAWPEGDLSDHDDPDGRPGEAEVTVVCNGILRRLGQGAKPLRSALYRHLSTDPDVLAYWPMEDGATAAVGDRRLGFSGGIEWASDETLPASGSLPGISGKSNWIGRVPSGHVTDWVAHQLVRLPEIVTDTTVLQVWLNGARLRVTLSATEIAIDVQEGEGAWVGGTPVPLTDDPTTTWLRVSLDARFAGGVYVATVNRAGDNNDVIGQAITGGIAVASPDLTAVGGRNAAPPSGMAAGHLTVALYPGAGTVPGPVGGVPDELAEVELAWIGETSVARTVRLCAEENIDLVVTGDSGQSTPMGPQLPATLLDLLSQCADSEEGILGEQVDRPGLTFRTRASRYNQPVDITLDAAADEIDAPFAPMLDDQRLRNDITVTREEAASAQAVDQASVDTEGTYDETVTLSLATDDQARHHAAWRLRAGVWDGMRYPSLSASLDTAPAALLDVGLGDRVQVVNLPPQHPEAAVDVLIEGTTETITNVDWRIEANCSPAGIWDVSVLDGPDTLDETFVLAL